MDTDINFLGYETVPEVHSGYIRHGLDGDGRFIPADIVCVHTLSLLLSSRVAHDRATEDNHTQQTESLTLSL